MARFERLTVYGGLKAAGVIPVFYHPDAKVAIEVVKACAAGGANCIEMTNRGDAAIDVFREIEAYCRENLPEVIMGVGSICDPGTASLYINYGANFIVGPLLDEDTAIACNKRKVAYSPGCGSLTEIGQAHALGVEIVKIFPGSQVGGPAFVKAAKGPCPWTSIMPTGGVDPTRESLEAWFGAGITCAGIGSKLITKEILESQNYGEITEKVKEVKATIKEIRGF
ncbi:MAG: bifunctional 4-hydroxy-2-oxoglutarate aldolase/2-dehydro-3-deoxy-phosphogluconate aldolase [Planctomycetota bacterium]|jgi:2-dehydro-3-deoxyphosphogluconate aldolase/(4S)-4-hydroxy-2-oxoglutarate aldolase